MCLFLIVVLVSPLARCDWTQVRADADPVGRPAAVAQRRHRGDHPPGDRAGEGGRARVRQHKRV